MNDEEILKETTLRNNYDWIWSDITDLMQKARADEREKILDIWRYATKEAMNTKWLLREVKYRIEALAQGDSK